MESAPSSDHSDAWSPQSLRVRLPLYLGALLVVVLGSFLWAAHREVANISLRTGHDRADAAARQIAEMLAGSVTTLAAQIEEMASRPAVAAFIRSADSGTGDRASTDPASPGAGSQPAVSRDSVRMLLRPLADAAFRRVEVWSASGSLLLAVDGSSSPDSLPALAPAPPDGAGVSPFRTSAGDPSTFDVVVEVRGGESGSTLLGFLRRSARVISGSVDRTRRLVGEDASVRFGTIGGEVWTDLNESVETPPLEVAGGVEGVDYGGTRWIGATAPVAGTPWMVWVGFPSAVVSAPARHFLREGLLLALFFVSAGAVLATLLGVRLTRPLRDIAREAERIAAGDYTRRVGTDRKDEIGRLGIAFNTMIDRIEEVHGAVRESHEQTHFALAAARVGVWESEIGGERMTCSESMAVLLGLPDGQLDCTRDEILDRVHPDDREPVRRIFDGRGVGDEVFDFEFRAVDSDGGVRWLEGRGRRKEDVDGRPSSVLAVVGDTTERRRLESQLRQAQKMEAVGQLAGGVAHDFNNLLTSIVGHGSLVLSDLDPDDPMREDVAAILRAGRSGARLTRQLLAFSRRQVMQPEVVTVHSVIGSTEELLRRLIGEKIDFVTRITHDVHAVRADRGLLEQVLMNLAVNARDAMPDGGTLTLAARNVELVETKLGEHASAPPGRYVVLSVEDTGIGMETETRAHLFEPFFTTKGPGKGTGLGLATVFGIVKQSGGHVFVRTEPGRGTVFEVYLPAAEPDGASEPPEARSVGGGGTG